MKFKALALTCVLSTTHAFAGFFVENDKVMAEVQTYTKGDKNIVLIDMIHVAPKSFYSDVNKKIASFKNTNPVILEEGVKHCQNAGDVMYLPLPGADFNTLAELYHNKNKFDAGSAEAMLALAGFGKAQCQRGSTNARPSVIDRFSSRFSLYGLIAGLGMVRSQGSVNVYPKGVTLASGDIASASFKNPITKALAGSVVECMLSLKAEGGCKAFKTWSETEEGKELTEEVVMELRNDVLLAATFKAIGVDSSYGQEYAFNAGSIPQSKTVILPWGAAHMPGGLTDAIEQMGFTKTETSGIAYTTCTRVKRNSILGLILGEDEAVKAGCNL
jgi:hypothetical protein